MNESVYTGLESFASVWQRVTGEMEADDGAERLRRLIQAETDAAAFYTALARRSAGRAGTLFAIAADDARHARLLQLEYFLLTGDTFAPAKGGQDAKGVLSALRQGYLGKRRSEREYRALSEKYASIADDEARHAQSLRAVIADFFGR